MSNELCELCKFSETGSCGKNVLDIGTCLNTEQTEFKPKKDTSIYPLAYLLAPSAYQVVKKYYPSPISEEENKKLINYVKWVMEGDWWKDEPYPHPTDEVYLEALNNALTKPLPEI